MLVDPEKIVFDTDASLDGITGHLDFTEPLDSSKGVEADRVVHLIMDNKDRAQIAAQLNTFIDGTADLTARLHGDGKQDVTADLTRAKVDSTLDRLVKRKGYQSVRHFYPDRKI